MIGRIGERPLRMESGLSDRSLPSEGKEAKKNLFLTVEKSPEEVLLDKDIALRQAIADGDSDDEGGNILFHARLFT